MDIRHAKEVLRRIERGDIKVVVLPENDVPSPFSHNIVLLGLSDVVLMEDKRLVLERLHEIIMTRISKSMGQAIIPRAFRSHKDV